MWPCRTRRSTSPTGTSRSTSEPRSSRAATSPRRSRRRSDASSTPQEGLREGFDEHRRPRGPRRRAQGPVHGAPRRRVDGHASNSRQVRYRVYRGRRGKYVLHVEREPEFWTVDAEGKPAGWRGYLGIGDIRYGSSPKESTLEVVETLERAPRQGPARAVRDGRALRSSADRGGARHLAPSPAPRRRCR